MKKLLGSTLALAMFLPVGASAELLKNFKASGSLDVQATSAENVTDFNTHNNDHIGTVFTRTMVKLDWDLLDDVHAHVSMSKGNYSNCWWSCNSSTPRTWGNNGENLQNIQNEIVVTEANVKIDKLFGAIDTTIGRQYYGEAGDFVAYFGPRDNYGLIVESLDAFRFDWNGEKVGVTGIGATLSGQGNLNSPGSSSYSLAGLVANLKGNEMASGSAYLYNQTGHASGNRGALGGKNDVLWIAGLKGKASVAGLTANAEIAKDFGQNRQNFGGGAPGADASYSGWALLLNAGYKLDLSKLGMVNPWGEYGYGSGRSRSTSNHNDGWVAINNDYRPGGIYGRFDQVSAEGLSGATSSGLANRVIYGLGVKVTPAAVAKLTVGAQYYHYAFARTSDANTFGANTQYGRSIGTEYDVTADWKHSENVNLKLTLGSFQPGQYIADIRGANATINPATLVAFDTSIKF